MNKFRVCDKREKKYDDDHYFYIGEDETLYISNDDGDIFEAEKDRYIVEHCTGLTDKNGKEIFEGDIIKIAYPDKNYQIQSVLFKDAAFCGYGEKKCCKWTLLDVIIRNYAAEIIGNIHEVQNEK